VNALWPKTVIATAAVQNLLGGDSVVNASRKPEIMADAAHWILTRKSTEYTGHFAIDEDVLRGAGVSDFSTYATTPGTKDSELIGDYFL
jgi:citronellol/citronellal dehydrogenase